MLGVSLPSVLRVAAVMVLAAVCFILGQQSGLISSHARSSEPQARPRVTNHPGAPSSHRAPAAHLKHVGPKAHLKHVGLRTHFAIFRQSSHRHHRRTQPARTSSATQAPTEASLVSELSPRAVELFGLNPANAVLVDPPGSAAPVVAVPGSQGACIVTQTAPGPPGPLQSPNVYADCNITANVVRTGLVGVGLNPDGTVLLYGLFPDNDNSIVVNSNSTGADTTVPVDQNVATADFPDQAFSIRYQDATGAGTTFPYSPAPSTPPPSGPSASGVTPSQSSGPGSS